MIDDDFTVIPSGEWREIRRDAGFARTFAWLAFCLLALLIFTLIEKGVLAGWSDLFRPAAPASG